jgi:hypothetical protein
MTAYSKHVVFTMGSKGGIGKTGVMASLAEWFATNEIPVTLLDLDTENKARGSLKHFFNSTVTKVNIHTPAGLDAFVDYLDGSTHHSCRYGSWCRAGAADWFESMYEDVACFYANSPYYGIVEKLLMYGVLGGTPRYHALVDPARPAGEEIVTLLMQPRAVLENEVHFRLGSEQIREPAPYNAILAAIAGGETKFNRIQQLIDVVRGTLSKSLRTLLELGWIRRELPFGERSYRRALYRVADPFLAFWYRFVAPLLSELQFSDPSAVYASRVAPHLTDYMGWSVFEELCGQWL